MGASPAGCARSATPGARRLLRLQPRPHYEQRLELLRTLDVSDRLELALKLQRERFEELLIRKRIRDDVQEGADKQQRDYFLRKQMDSIRKELGEDEASIVEEYRTKIEAAEMPEQAHEQGRQGARATRADGDQSGEASMIRTYLDWLIAIPWNKRSEEHLDPVAARVVLDSDHAGLEDVKDRITEYLAVRKLRQDRGMRPTALGGDPDADRAAGTGKTSIGESIGTRHRSRVRGGCRSAASTTRPRSVATGEPTSGRCRAGSCARCAMPARSTP